MNLVKILSFLAMMEWASSRKIAEALGISARTVIRNADALVEQGVLEKRLVYGRQYEYRRSSGSPAGVSELIAAQNRFISEVTTQLGEMVRQVASLVSVISSLHSAAPALQDSAPEPDGDDEEGDGDVPNGPAPEPAPIPEEELEPAYEIQDGLEGGESGKEAGLDWPDPIPVRYLDSGRPEIISLPHLAESGKVGAQPAAWRRPTGELSILYIGEFATMASAAICGDKYKPSMSLGIFTDEGLAREAEAPGKYRNSIFFEYGQVAGTAVSLGNDMLMYSGLLKAAFRATWNVYRIFAAKSIRNYIGPKQWDLLRRIETLPGFGVGDERFMKFLEFLAYRKEVKKPYKAVASLNKLLHEFLVSKTISRSNIVWCSEVVGKTIANSWQGLFWDSVPEPKAANPQSRAFEPDEYDDDPAARRVKIDAETEAIRKAIASRKVAQE